MLVMTCVLLALEDNDFFFFDNDFFFKKLKHAKGREIGL